jgi:hypothetical protein
MTPQHPPASLYRTTEGLGLWEHRGKVAAVGDGGDGSSRSNALATSIGASDASILLYLGDLYEKGTPAELCRLLS